MRLSSSSAEEFPRVVPVVGVGRCFFCVEETGLVDGFQDLKNT